MSFKYNTRQFIREMECRPCLWNINTPEYHNKGSKELAWQEIAKVMYDEWTDLQTDEKTDRVKELQKKWKGLRDYYTREHNKKIKFKNGIETRRIRKSPYLDMLSFLSVKKKRLQAIRRRQSEETIGGNGLEDCHLHNQNRKDHASGLVPVTCRTTMQQPSAQPTNQMAIERQNNDPDTNFLFSILPDMKSMSPSQNFEFRYQVMTLIKNMKYSQQNNESYEYCAPRSSTFANPVSKYGSLDLEVDPIANESPEPYPEDVKVILQESPNNSPSQ